MTLDDAQDAFRNDGVPYNAQNYLEAVISYWSDEMIGDDTLAAAYRELAEWQTGTGQVLTDPRTHAQWVPA